MKELSEHDIVELRSLWRAIGGDFHGPHVETATMPEATLLPILRELVLMRLVEKAARNALPVVQFASARQGHAGSFATIYAGLQACLAKLDEVRQ